MKTTNDPAEAAYSGFKNDDLRRAALISRDKRLIAMHVATCLTIVAIATLGEGWIPWRVVRNLLLHAV